MSLVTAQGIRARSELDARISTIQDELHATVKGGDISLKEAFETFTNDSEQTVREAVWRLLNDRTVEIVSGTRLHLRDA